MAAVTPELLAQTRQLASIFMPSMWRAIEDLYPGGEGFARFAHYTSAENALKIIRTKRLWMRDAGCMVDYREIEHGYKIHLDLLNADNRRKRFLDALDASVPGVAQKGLNIFDAHWPRISRETFIASLSRHFDREDVIGRLSMWRAFGSSGVRVAIVARVPAFARAGTALQVTFTPISYATVKEAAEDLDDVISKISANAEFLKSLKPELVQGMVFAKFLIAAVSMKHEIFSEEREWRAVFTTLLGAAATIKLEHTVETVSGVPQKVYHLPLDRAVHEDVAALDFPEIFDSMIIGPTQYPRSLYDAFVEELEKAGVRDAANKIRISGIPLRTS